MAHGDDRRRLHDTGRSRSQFSICTQPTRSASRSTARSGWWATFPNGSGRRTVADACETEFAGTLFAVPRRSPDLAALGRERFTRIPYERDVFADAVVDHHHEIVGLGHTF